MPENIEIESLVRKKMAQPEVSIAQGTGCMMYFPIGESACLVELCDGSNKGRGCVFVAGEKALLVVGLSCVPKLLMVGGKEIGPRNE